MCAPSSRWPVLGKQAAATWLIRGQRTGLALSLLFGPDLRDGLPFREGMCKGSGSGGGSPDVTMSLLFHPPSTSPRERTHARAGKAPPPRLREASGGVLHRGRTPARLQTPPRCPLPSETFFFKVLQVQLGAPGVQGAVFGDTSRCTNVRPGAKSWRLGGGA